MRKMAIVCALDGVTCDGKSGSEIFPEFTPKGLGVLPFMQYGRGIAIAEDIRKPIATDFLIACCCVNFAMHVMEHRRKPSTLFTDQVV